MPPMPLLPLEVLADDDADEPGPHSNAHAGDDVRNERRQHQGAQHGWLGGPEAPCHPQQVGVDLPRTNDDVDEQGEHRDQEHHDDLRLEPDAEPGDEQRHARDQGGRVHDRDPGVEDRAQRAPPADDDAARYADGDAEGQAEGVQLSAGQNGAAERAVIDHQPGVLEYLPGRTAQRLVDDAGLREYLPQRQAGQDGRHADDLVPALRDHPAVTPASPISRGRHGRVDRSPGEPGFVRRGLDGRVHPRLVRRLRGDSPTLVHSRILAI
jgi:hypothetical protein